MARVSANLVFGGLHRHRLEPGRPVLLGQRLARTHVREPQRQRIVAFQKRGELERNGLPPVRFVTFRFRVGNEGSVRPGYFRHDLQAPGAVRVVGEGIRDLVRSQLQGIEAIDGEIRRKISRRGRLGPRKGSPMDIPGKLGVAIQAGPRHPIGVVNTVDREAVDKPVFAGKDDLDLAVAVDVPDRRGGQIPGAGWETPFLPAIGREADQPLGSGTDQDLQLPVAVHVADTGPLDDSAADIRLPEGFPVSQTVDVARPSQPAPVAANDVESSRTVEVGQRKAVRLVDGVIALPAPLLVAGHRIADDHLKVLGCKDHLVLPIPVHVPNRWPRPAEIESARDLMGPHDLPLTVETGRGSPGKRRIDSQSSCFFVVGDRRDTADLPLPLEMPERSSRVVQTVERPLSEPNRISIRPSASISAVTGPL